MPVDYYRCAWPHGKRFAFTIVDDTDRATVKKARPVYDFLLENGFLTTKTVWPLRATGKPITGGQTLEDEAYKEWILSLQAVGFEIALHGVSDMSSTRERIVQGLEYFHQVVGDAPRIHVNHVGQAESLYWGQDRFDGVVKPVYQLKQAFSKSDAESYGHRQDSPYFWGDLARERITYVRNLIFKDINTLKVDPLMPYHVPARPYVRYWFSSSYGSGVDNFCRLLSEDNQDRLMAEGGACIVYTHLGTRFWRYELNLRFMELMRRLARLPGWFVPASTLLDYLREHRVRPDQRRRPRLLSRMNRSWFWDQLSIPKE